MTESVQVQWFTHDMGISEPSEMLDHRRETSIVQFGPKWCKWAKCEYVIKDEITGQ